MPADLPTKEAASPSWSRHARRITAIYAVFASLWILTSDRALFHLFDDFRDILWINISKGLLFVGTTSVLLWFLMRRMLLGLQKSQDALAKQEQEIRESRSRLRALLTRLEQAREAERTRISREVHDVLGQLLTGMKMNLSWITNRIPPDSGNNLKIIAKLNESDSIANAILSSIQEIAYDLRPGILDRLGLVPALRFEAERFTKRTGIPCQFNTHLERIELRDEKATHVFRVVQELLTNVARHSSASMATVHIGRSNEHCVVTVTDNGTGISDMALKDRHSLGLLGMSERAMLLGGTISIQRSRERGTIANLTFSESSS
jgi:signal transduction histidine kinase